MAEDNDPGPVQALHEQLTDTFADRPFRYADVERRYSDTFDNLQQTFASTVAHHDYDHGPIKTTDHDSGHAAALADLRNYLDEQDAWFLHTSFRIAASDLEQYMDAVPALNDEALDQLYDDGYLSHHGGIAIVTDDGWEAIYQATNEPVYTIETRLASDPVDRS